MAVYSRQHYRSNRDAYIERTARWQSENRARRRETLREWSLRNKYGLSLSDFAEMSARQSHRCVCGDDGPLVVDHDHATGEVRGLLCNNCNLALGLLRDDPSRLAALRRYLEGGDAQWLPDSTIATT